VNNRVGWTLHEMLISLCVMSGILAVVAHQAASQIRLYGGIQQASFAGENRMQAQAIAERMLWPIAPQAGDLTLAQDSALQLQLPIGSSVVCSATPGAVTVAAGSTQRGSVLAGFSDMPEAGDRIAALFHDSTGTTWLTFRISSAPMTASCARFPVAPAWQLSIIEPIAIPAGAAVRFVRPLRLSLYKSSDSRWFLGAREWNNASDRFNTIQPVSGPYTRYDEDPYRSGLAFLYYSRTGERLEAPVDPSRVGGISIVVRASTTSKSDSGVVSVVLRNIP
jgi:hypothetical protein